MAENADGKQQQRLRNKKYMLVRHGRMHHIGLFEHSQNEIPKTPTRVVVKTSRGLELGEVVGHLTCYKGGKFKLDGDQIDEYFKVSEVDISCQLAGKLVRFASDADINESCHFKKAGKEEIDTCRRIARELNLDMKVVQAEHILGGERLIFYFMAEGRIDFRELVRQLSHEFQTRIEMRQIGARDEAKLLGDVESCGQEICCRRFLKYLKPVNMRMAKMQKATLDPAKISGYCGRLKCCLRYEDETYDYLKKRLPKRNAIVRTPKGEGCVLDTQILTQLVIVGYEGNEREAVSVDDIQVLAPGQQRRKPSDAPPANERRTPTTESAKSESESKPASVEAATEISTEAAGEVAGEAKAGETVDTARPSRERGRSRGQRRNDSSEKGDGKQDGKGRRRRRPSGQKRRGPRNKPNDSQSEAQGASPQGDNNPRQAKSAAANDKKPDTPNVGNEGKSNDSPNPPVKGTEKHDA